MLDRATYKNILEKLIKHFDTYGFPQPLQGRDVGPIQDWRFLAGDSNSRTFEVDKADKQIGTNFGRVLYWLICSARYMPLGMAVIAYYDQHIALVRFLGSRFGYRVLNTTGDLNLTGPHLQLNKKLRATFHDWVVIMPSETLIAERRMTSENTMQDEDTPHAQAIDALVISNPSTPDLPFTSPRSVASIPSVTPTVTGNQALITSDNSRVQLAGSSLSDEALQSNTAGFEHFPRIEATTSMLPSTSSGVQFNMPSSTAEVLSDPINDSIATSGLTSHPSVVRRKAPPPPRKVILAKALYNFKAEEWEGETEKELTFSEGDIVEIVEKNEALEEDGWCRARIQGQKRIGLAPLGYLEEVPNEPVKVLPRRLD